MKPEVAGSIPAFNHHTTGNRGIKMTKQQRLNITLLDNNSDQFDEYQQQFVIDMAELDDKVVLSSKQISLIDDLLDLMEA